MADGGEPFTFNRPARASRFWFIAPAEPKDFRTFQALCEAAMTNAREDLLAHGRAAALLAAIGKHGREGQILSLQVQVSAIVLTHLAKTNERQRVKSASVDFHAVPLPKLGRLEGTLIIRGWGHTLRSTFDPIIGK